MSDGEAAKRKSVRSLLAGGGLAAAALTAAGSVSCEALAAQAPTVTNPGGAATSTTPESPAPTTSSATTGTTTPTSVGPTPTTSTQTTTPTKTTPTSTQTAPTSTAQAPQPHAGKAPHGKAPQAVLQHTQQATTTPSTTTPTTPTATASPTSTTPNSSGNIAPAPQLAAAQSGALAAMMSDAASLQALDFYRIPLFLLPIYQAAAVQYGVPWQVLAAINEVETNFGTDLSVSTAGAVGWMQFMPETWLQYGVDALDAGYADPYNPVDAIFAAARYLHAAGASSNLRAAILAYNHSEAYVESVLLRARLFASYPASTIATLTGLTEGTPPVAGATVTPGSPIPQAPSPSSAAGASGAAGESSATAATAGGQASATTGAPPTPSAISAPAPQQSAAAAQRVLDAPSPASQLSELAGRQGAPVVAVEDGRIVGLGVSRKIGDYLVLRDTYGDVFTYGALGSIAPAYRSPRQSQLRVPKGALPSGEAGGNPTPTQAATAGSQSPLTIHVAARRSRASTGESQGSSGQGSSGAGTGTGSVRQGTGEADAVAGGQLGGGKIRVFAHPGNPDALAARREHERGAQRAALTPGWMALGRGSLVAQGTVIGHLASGGEGPDANLRFAIRPPGAQSAIDPRPILENWRQLQAALHPRGAKDSAVLAGATAADAFLLSGADLERAVLADPGIQMGACDRSQVAAGKVDRHALALLVFLSRSGLKPTVGELRCGSQVSAANGRLMTVFPAPGTLDIAAINGVPIAGHQGAGTIADVTIRTLLTVKRQFAPTRIVSLMGYPGAPRTVAEGDHSTFIELDIPSGGRRTGATVAAGNHGAAKTAAASSATAQASLSLDTFEWQRLIDQIAAIPQPNVSRAPSAAAIRDARP